MRKLLILMMILLPIVSEAGNNTKVKKTKKGYVHKCPKAKKVYIPKCCN